MVAQHHCQRCELVHPPGPCPDPETYSPEALPSVEYLSGYALGLAEGFGKAVNARPEIGDAGDCDGGCPDCILQPPAYVHGYVHGKSKVHFEIRFMRSDHDAFRCGCEPCITVREVLSRFGLLPHRPDAESGADHPDFPGYKICPGCLGPDDGHYPDCVVALAAKRREATPEESEYLARLLEQYAAPMPEPDAGAHGEGCSMNDGGQHVYERDAFGLSCAACAKRFSRAA